MSDPIKGKTLFVWYNYRMQACSNYIRTNHLDYNVEQLRLPLDLSVVIDKYDPLWSFLEVIKEVNLKKYLKPHRGNQGHNMKISFRCGNVNPVTDARSEKTVRNQRRTAG